MWHKVSFKQNRTSLKLEFSFSNISCQTKAKEHSLPYYLPIAGGRTDVFIQRENWYCYWLKILSRTASFWRNMRWASVLKNVSTANTRCAPVQAMMFVSEKKKKHRDISLMELPLPLALVHLQYSDNLKCGMDFWVNRDMTAHQGSRVQLVCNRKETSWWEPRGLI